MTTTNLSKVVRESLRDAAAVLLPVRCAGCGGPDRAVCGSCARALAASPHRQTLAGLPVWTGLEYAAVPRTVVLAFKDGGRTDAAPSLARVLRPVVAAARQEMNTGARDALVPVLIPSTRESWRRRGFHPTGLVLARSRILRPPLWRALQLARQTADQSGLSAAARTANREGSMLGSARLGGRDCLLVDDIVTTGATLTEAARAVSAAGGRVVGAAAIARTPLRRS